MHSSEAGPEVGHPSRVGDGFARVAFLREVHHQDREQGELERREGDSKEIAAKDIGEAQNGREAGERAGREHARILNDPSSATAADTLSQT